MLIGRGPSTGMLLRQDRPSLRTDVRDGCASKGRALHRPTVHGSRVVRLDAPHQPKSRKVTLSRRYERRPAVITRCHAFVMVDPTCARVLDFLTTINLVLKREGPRPLEGLLEHSRWPPRPVRTWRLPDSTRCWSWRVAFRRFGSEPKTGPGLRQVLALSLHHCFRVVVPHLVLRTPPSRRPRFHFGIDLSVVGSALCPVGPAPRRWQLSTVPVTPRPPAPQWSDLPNRSSCSWLPALSWWWRWSETPFSVWRCSHAPRSPLHSPM
jgi:hypothetical protein